MLHEDLSWEEIQVRVGVVVWLCCCCSVQLFRGGLRGMLCKRAACHRQRPAQPTEGARRTLSKPHSSPSSSFTEPPPLALPPWRSGAPTA